jgi:hypothetical protein
MQTGKNVGMCTFADDLLSLVKRGIISPEEAYSNAIDKPFLLKKLDEEKITIDLSLTALDDIDMHMEEGENASKSEKARKKLHVNPRDTTALRDLIIILATDENPDERNGVEALEYSQKLLDITGQSEAVTLVLIGAAYAELSHFGEAADWSKKALKVAKSNKQKEIAVDIQRYINLYKRGIPLRGETIG